MALEHINSWSQRAKCRDIPFADEVFFPHQTGGSKKINDVGRKFCTDCIVRSQCKIYAIAHNVHGIWGGTTKAERDRVSGFTRQAIRIMYTEAHQLEPLTYKNSEIPLRPQRLPQAVPDPISHVDRELGPILTPVLEATLPYTG